MGLSNDLISQFVKVTNDEKKEPVETIVYGTIVYDGRTYVKLDGSDLLTPISTTADIKEGERVTVLIKNHTAMVTGNMTSPSAGIHDVHNVQNKVEINTEQIGVVNGRVDLNNAEIENLKATNAEIKNLMFDSATGKNLSVEFANMVVAQIGEAQIKSAMIESVTANKILGGNIYTNNVHVMSEDGNMIIADETIQISDENRVRVQIGKDASGDYSINIWDADGKLMFSEGGLTDNAIKDAIIRDDMISDNANISAGKIDISSLFTEINGSEETINSTRIFLDNENQTLDVVFKSMTSDIEDIDESVKTLGTQLSIAQGQIDSKIWKQDIDDATNTLTDEFSNVTQTIDSLSTTVKSHTSQIQNKADLAEVTEVRDLVTSVEASLDGFKTTVSDNYAMKQDVLDIVDVGGRNLALRGGDSVTVNGLTLEVSGFDYHIHGRNTNTSANYGLSFWTARSDIFEPGAEYTISTTVPLPTGLYLGVNTRNANGNETMAGTPSSYLYGDGELKSQTFTCIADSDGYLHGFFGVLKSCGTVDVTFRLKLEKGNTATDWSPAPEDLATSDELESVRNDVNATINSISELSVTAGEIDASVKKVTSQLDSSLESLGSDISTLSQQVSAKVSPEDVQITIREELENGTNKVVTNTGFTFDDTGMTVAKSDSEMKTQITENGMTVYQNDTPTLTANNQGVEAKNLHASTYLIVGENSRFEDYIIRTNLAQNGDGPYSAGTNASYGFWDLALDTYSHGIVLEANRDYELTFDWTVDWGSASNATQVMCTVGCGSTAGAYSWDISGVTNFDTANGKTSGRMVHAFRLTEEDISYGQYFAMRPVRTGAENSLDGSTWTITNVCINSLKHRTGCFWIGGV